MLERWHVFFAQGIAIVEAGRPRLGVPRAVEEQVDAARRRVPELRSEGEEEGDLLAAVENAARVIPAIPGEGRRERAPPAKRIGEPDGERAGQIEDPERARIGSRKKAQQLLDGARRRAVVFDRERPIAIVAGRGEGRGAKPRLERPRAPAPRAHGLGHAGLGPRGERARARHQKPRKPIAPTMTAASTMKSPSSSMPSMVLPVASSLTKSRGSIQ